MTLKVKSLLVAALALQLSSAAAWAKDDAPRITVTGEGVVAAVPDVASLVLRVISLEDSGSKALQATTDKTNRLLQALEGFGISATDMQTSGLALGPEYDYPGNGEPRVLRGYGATTTLTLRLRDLEKTGALLDLVMREGAAEFDNLSFSHSSPNGLRDEARVAAVKEARRRAALMAEAEGLAPGKVVSIREVQPDSGPMMMMQASPAAADMRSMKIAPGEVTYNVQLEVIYDLVKP